MTLFTPASAAEAADPPFEAEIRTWCLALEAYRHQHWNQAETHLRELKALSLQTRSAGSLFEGLAARFCERITLYRSAPPSPDWDGAYTFDSK